MLLSLFRVALLISTLTLSFVSCSYDDNRTSVAPIQDGESANWTVLFYGAGNTRSDLNEEGESNVIETLESMQGVYAVNSVNVVVAISSDRTDRHMRIYDVSPSAGEDYLDWGVRDMSSPQTLADFIAHGVEHYSTDHIALVIMGDGTNWRGVLRDDELGTVAMQLSDFRTAVQTTANHVDLIAWLVPGMSSVETAYECHAISDYMVGCAWPLAHDVTFSPRVWLMDLMQNSGMSAERLGMMMVDGLYESARSGNDSAHYALLRLSNISSLVPEVDSLAIALRPYTEDHELELPALWNSAWVATTDDSQSVDVGRMTSEVLDEPVLAADPIVSAAAAHVISSLENLVIYRRSTVPGEVRHGVSIYLPYQPDSTSLAQYGELSLSQEHPGWHLLLEAYAATAPTLNGVKGNVRWAGHVLGDLYFFANTNQAGAPSIGITHSAAITETISEDYVSYSTSFAMEQDSLPCYIGVFQDLDLSGSLSTGDRYGYYHLNAQPQRDWITLHIGETLNNINIELDRTF